MLWILLCYIIISWSDLCAMISEHVWRKQEESSSIVSSSKCQNDDFIRDVEPSLQQPLNL